MITGYGTIESAVEAIKMGAYDYLTKPIIDDEIRLVVERALQQQSLIRENRTLRQQLDHRYELQNIVGHDYKMLKVFDLIESVADSKTTVLIQGESGTGKSMIARAIHHHSRRRDQPFVEVACGAMPETLLESELFGHVKGSFTGAVGDKEGKFKAADSGTIFLDEICSATPALQVKLLRVLQERQFEPVGSNETKTVDVRVILASNANLAKDVAEGRFRQDLYYRINVVTDPPAAAARADRRHPAAGRALPAQVQRPERPRGPGLHRRGHGGPAAVQLAGQRPRTGERGRAGGRAQQEQVRRGQRPARQPARSTSSPTRRPRPTTSPSRSSGPWKTRRSGSSRWPCGPTTGTASSPPRSSRSTARRSTRR